jgi:hypothetical protein
LKHRLRCVTHIITHTQICKEKNYLKPYTTHKECLNLQQQKKVTHRFPKMKSMPTALKIFEGLPQIAISHFLSPAAYFMAQNFFIPAMV